MSEPVLAAEGLVKSFGALTATAGVSLSLRPGEIHALIGPNGAGKSTLIRLLSGELAPDAGHVRFAGRSVDGLDAPARARLGLARSFQVSAVAPEMSARENVMTAVAAVERRIFRFFLPVSRDRALRAASERFLDEAGLPAARAGLRAADLSHGERRQLEIAMALALGPRAFLLDEPMAGMGADGAVHLTGFLARLRTRAPVLLVEHDMDAVFALADRVSVLAAGRVIATGTVNEIRRNPDVRHAYLGDDGPP